MTYSHAALQMRLAPSDLATDVILGNVTISPLKTKTRVIHKIFHFFGLFVSRKIHSMIYFVNERLSLSVPLVSTAISGTSTQPISKMKDTLDSEHT
jgi:hypothetical protein